MFGLDDDEHAARFDAVASSGKATYRDTVEALGPNFEGGYFLYRFSDPTYIVAQAVARAVGAAVLGGTRRAIDICGGSAMSRGRCSTCRRPRPVLADLYFAKVWLARRFTAPGCEPVCCDGNAADAVRARRLRLRDVHRRVHVHLDEAAVRRRDGAPDRSGHGDDHAGRCSSATPTTRRAWSPSHGQPLPPEGYAALFETLTPRVFGEAGLFEDVVRGGPLDLSRRDDPAALDSDPALTIIASRNPRVFAPHPLPQPAVAAGESENQSALRRRSRWRAASPAARVPVRGLRAGIRRLPTVSA
jgi:hypothetical protein